MVERSDGNPLFVEELAATLTDDPAAPMPPYLRDAVISRVERLPAETSAVLRACAIGGREVEHDLLAEVVGLPPAALEDALRACVDHRLLVADQGGAATGSGTPWCTRRCWPTRCDEGRVDGVVVRTRRVGGPRPTLTIHADLVVDARAGYRQIPLAPAADGLLALGPFSPGPGADGDGGATRATTTAAVLDRCLTEHLRQCATLSGFSVTAQRAVAQADPGWPAGSRR